MQKSLWLLSLFILLGSVAFSQYGYTRYIVQLTDKKGTQYSLGSPGQFLSQKALDRRAKSKVVIDSTDLPISKPYLDSIRSVPNVTVLNQSKWMNQLLIKTGDPSAIAKINSFPFVKSAMQIAPRATNFEEIISRKFEPVSNEREEIISKKYGSEGVQLNYGSSYNQIHIHEGEFLHDQGFTGKGITIAILDAGFKNYKTNPAFDSVRMQGRVLGEWDYVANEQSVNEDDQHGANCFSIIAANIPGTIVGSGPGASFYLFRTEDVSTEYPVEEQNWVAAAEYADSVGADMISTSLGYNIFDNSAFNHTYPQRDGNTSLVTRAADLAAHKGMIVTVSAGNDGSRTDDYKYVMCPADADSVLTVGAINIAGQIANFSCWGPNYAGRIKPNVVSVGVNTVLANSSGTPVPGSGTSYANPNMAGLVASLWQAFPEFANMEIIDAVQKSSDRYNAPDGRYGYGIPNFKTAFNLLATQRQARKYASLLGSDWIRALPVPYQKQITIILKAPSTGKGSLLLIDAAGQILEKKSLDLTQNNTSVISFSRASLLSGGIYFVRFEDGSVKRTIKILKN